ncbi:MAG: GNAT family N-acetyltransferase [Dehalococcoidia bacterium]|nr:GNAT family N-acetyltransferase [Dehalococcoidia bacterium]
MGLSVKNEEIGSLAGLWEELRPSCSSYTVFSIPQWYAVWWQFFGDGKESVVLSVRDREELIGLAPLMRDGDCVSFIGDTNVSDYMDFITTQGREEDVLSAVFGYLKSQRWGRLELHCIPESSAARGFLVDLCKSNGFSTFLETEEVCPLIKLPPTWDEYLGGLSRKDRHELRRKLRRLEGAGTVHYYAAEDNEGLPLATEEFLRLHKESREDKAAFMTDEMQNFFRALTAEFVRLGIGKLYFMEIDGKKVSATLCFDYENTLYLYNSGYDPSFSYLSVGLLLKSLCIRDALENGKAIFDFLRGDEPYKYDLGGQDTSIYKLTVTRT